MQALRIENLQKSFGAISVLKGVDMTINNGEVVAVIGRSGSGKSTMLRCINGLESFNSGLIEVAGHRLDGTTKRLRDLRKEVGMVFQSYNLFPHLTVAENIKLAPRVVKNLPVAEQNALEFRSFDRRWNHSPIYAYGPYDVACWDIAGKRAGLVGEKRAVERVPLGSDAQASLRPLATIMPAAPSSHPAFSSSARKRDRSKGPGMTRCRVLSAKKPKRS